MLRGLPAPAGRGQPWRLLALALSAWFVGALAWACARRLAYPYDLEWMEGGMLCHALRLIDGQPLYAPPALDFVPYLYTPFYSYSLFLLSKLFPLGYALGRALSLLGFAAALLAAYLFVRRQGSSRAAAAVAVALPCAAFVPTGAWYDLARPDSLFLGLVTLALVIGWWTHGTARPSPSWRTRGSGARSGWHPLTAAAAAVLMVAAFFTKQTATPFMIALGLALLAVAPRAALIYGAVMAALGLPLLYHWQRASHGWFWTYVSVLHRQHDFYAVRAFVATPIRLVLLLGPALLLVPWALLRRRTPGLVYAAWIAGAGVAAACVGFGTQWAFNNAFIPGVTLPALAIGVAAGRLTADDAHDPTPERRPAVVYCLLALSLACAPGGLVALGARVAPPSWGFADGNDGAAGWRLGRTVPTAADRAAGDAVVARLRAAPGEVLIPFHPFYARLAGKRPYLHRMGVLDVGRAGMGAPAGLAEAIAERRFALVVMDDKIDGNWQMWPGLLQRYRIAEVIHGARVLSGAQTMPRYLLTPSGSDVIDRDLQ